MIMINKTGENNLINIIIFLINNIFPKVLFIEQEKPICA